MNAKEEHTKVRITREAQYFDLDRIALPNSNLPHTMPDLATFTQNMKNLLIRPTDEIVVYDAMGMFSAARCAWMFRFFGAENVRILNGGMKKWLSEKRDVYTLGGYSPGFGLPKDGDFNYKVVNQDLVITDINKIHQTAYYIFNKATDSLILDARSPARFNAEVAEPRAGVRAGHITGSKNLFFGNLVNPDGTLKSNKAIAKVSLERI